VAAWLWGIAARRLVDRFRRRVLPTTALREDVPDGGSTEDAVLGEVEHTDLAEALRTLSPEFRAVVQATAIDGLTTREAAVLLGIPVGTVKTRMMRARAQLRKALS
jgi:RNA polymerase sigma-70 factor, ECF subfamily